MGLLYNFVKYSGRIALPMFFGRLEINGRHHIPKDQPYLVAPNHQNAFLDAILMGVYLPRPVHFLTRSDVFVPPFIGALEALNMMPIYRIRDGYEKLSRNEEVFAKCEALLQTNFPVLIFPEGNMDKRHYLRPLSKGTARLAFQSQRNIDKDLLILPVGINYFDHYRPRHKCIVNFGKPIRVRDLWEQYETHSAKGLIALRNNLSDSMKELLLIPEKENYNHKKLALHRKNESIEFSKLREKIARDAFRNVTYYPSLKIVVDILTIFNPIAILGVKWLLKTKIRQRQFIASIKYTVGQLVSVFWWILVLGVMTYLFEPSIGWIATICCMIMLFLRSEINKMVSPPEE